MPTRPPHERPNVSMSGAGAQKLGTFAKLVIAFAVVLFAVVHPNEALVIALLLALMPYVVIRWAGRARATCARGRGPRAVRATGKSR